MIATVLLQIVLVGQVAVSDADIVIRAATEALREMEIPPAEWYRLTKNTRVESVPHQIICSTLGFRAGCFIGQDYSDGKKTVTIKYQAKKLEWEREAILLHEFRHAVGWLYFDDGDTHGR